MPDEPSLDPNGANSTPTPEADAPKSFREIAEAAYDEAAAAPETPETPETRVDEAGRVRDASGRFAPVAKPGEQSAEDPAPTVEPPAPTAQPVPTQPTGAVEAPQNWSAADREMLSKAPPDMQAWAVRRHKEMEADYTAKTQQASTAVNFVQSLTPVFTDPVIAGSLQQEGVSPPEAIRQWAAYHRAAMSPNVEDRHQVLRVMAQRMQVDPAKVFNLSGTPQPPPGLTEAEMKDPAIRFFAERDSKRASELNEVQQTLQQIQQAAQTERQQAQLQASRWSVDNFAEERGSDGQPLHPHFDRVLPQLLTLYRADRTIDLKTAYATACRMNPEVHAEMLAAERAAAERRYSTQRASAAVRGNARGLTNPVRPPPANANGKAESFREVAERVADELGFE